MKNEQPIDEKPHMTIRFKSPCACGLVLEHRAVHHGSTEGPPKDWIRSAAAQLEYWLTDRLARHKCELVSPENPLGNSAKRALAVEVQHGQQ